MAAFLLYLKNYKKTMEIGKMFRETILYKMGRGRLFHHNLPYFLIVDKELNCIFSICSKYQTCFRIIWIVKINVNIFDTVLTWSEWSSCYIANASYCLTILLSWKIFPSTPRISLFRPYCYFFTAERKSQLCGICFTTRVMLYNATPIAVQFRKPFRIYIRI